MTPYMQALINVCFTMATGVIIVAGLCSMMFMALLFWQFLDDYINERGLT